MPRSQRSIEDRLRDAVGDGLLTQEPLRHHTTFRIGGPADFYVAARTAETLVAALAAAHAAGLPVFLLGGGSNLLVSDEGIRGLVVHNAAEKVQFNGTVALVECGAGFTDLTTVLATPCTAPFLAPALGFAFSQPPAMIVLMFTAVAVGLAFPYLLLSCYPQWLKFLPRPGVWMEKFKMAMGFPMLATMVWLFSFNAKRFGPGGPLRIGLFLVLAALGAWVWGQFVQRGRRGRVVAALLSVAFFACGVGLARGAHPTGTARMGGNGVVQDGADVGRPDVDRRRVLAVPRPQQEVVAAADPGDAPAPVPAGVSRFWACAQCWTRAAGLPPIPGAFAPGPVDCHARDFLYSFPGCHGLAHPPGQLDPWRASQRAGPA